MTGETATTAAANERVQVIDRSVDLLEALADGPGSLTEICRTTGLSKTTAFRLLAGLAARGWVMKEPVAARYMLGPGLLRLVQGALVGVGAISTLGGNILQVLADATHETVALHAQSGVERVCIGEVVTDHPIRYASAVGSTAPLHVGSAGKILLASMEPELQRRSLEILHTAYPDVRMEHLRSDLAMAASAGWAISHGERVVGASAISVPVHTPSLVISLSVLGPSHRLTDQQLIDMLPSIREAAGGLTRVLTTPFTTLELSL